MVFSIFEVNRAGIPPAVAISDGMTEVVILKVDLNSLIECLEVVKNGTV